MKLFAGIALAIALMTCLPLAASSSPTSVPLQRGVLTGNYGLDSSADSVSVRAGDAGSNHREVFWSPQQPRLDGEVCATWASESAPTAQQGLALRIVQADGRTRAVTITKNVIFGATWAINAHVWDSGLDQPFQAIGQWDLVATLTEAGRTRPLPWRACARTIGATLSFRLWVLGVHAEPTWDTPGHTGSATIPAAWNVPGQFGLYAGHLPAGGEMVYTDVSVRAVSLAVRSSRIPRPAQGE